MPLGHQDKPEQDELDANEQKPKQEQADAHEGKGGGESAQEAEGGEAKSERDGAPKPEEARLPPSMSVHSPSSGDVFSSEGGVAVNYELASKMSDTCKAHFSLHKNGKVVHAGALEWPLKDHHFSGTFRMPPEQLGVGKFDLHYWASDDADVESPIQKVDFEVIDESKPKEEGAAPQGTEGGSDSSP
jgi:hypothetical protein